MHRHRVKVVALVLTLAVASAAPLAACVGDDPIGATPDATSPTTTSTGTTAPTTTTPPPTDGSSPDTSTPGDASAPDTSVAYTYEDPTVATKWESYTLRTAAAYAGGAFDGRYVYVTPSTDGTTNYSTVQRYDTQGAFTGAGWSSFDLTTATGGTNARNYYGTAFDGKYVYFVPNRHGLVARFDTKGAGGFASASNFTFLDVSSLGTLFGNAVFAGKYVYLLPGLGSGSRVVRIDTTLAFTAGAAEAFQTTDVDSNAYAFDGGTFDGTYLYLVSYKSNGPCPILRYEVAKPFTQAASWTAFDGNQVGSCGMRGGTFDGRYVYMAPHYGPTGYNGKMLRYDTRAPFTATSSYLVYDLATINGNLKAFAGAVFDGRRIYAVPQGSPQSGLVAIYDTTLPFDAATSWKSFDVTAISPNAKSFLGGVFDGRHLYLLPVSNGVVVRFDAKSPPGLPPGAGASFY